MRDIFDDLPLSSENEIPRHHNGKGDFEGYDESLSMSEYEELRLMLTSAKAAFAQEDIDITPDPQIHKNLRAMVAARKKPLELPAINFKKILNYPLPAYQFGLAMVLVVFMAILAGRNNGFNSTPNAGILNKTDTAFGSSHRNAAPVMDLSDSQNNMFGPVVIPAHDYFVDSSDIMNDNSSTDHHSPSGISHSSGSYLRTPRYKDIDMPSETDEPAKGGGPVEDTSKWNRHLHGLL